MIGECAARHRKQREREKIKTGLFVLEPHRRSTVLSGAETLQIFYSF